jgi:hypothetical protein
MLGTALAFTLIPVLAAAGSGPVSGGPARLAVTLCTLPWLGFVPDKVSAAPPVVVARLADQLGVDPDALRSYGRRAKTRTEHLRLVAKYLGWRLPTTLELKELDEFLLARAMEHDSPTLLFRLGCEYLISARVIRPGPVTVVERVAHARAEAQRETFDRLAHEFSETRCAALDGLLVTDPEVRMTRLRWLSTGPVEASPAAVKAEVAKLGFLRGLGADTLDLSERRRFLATVGRRLTAQALERMRRWGGRCGHDDRAGVRPEAWAGRLRPHPLRTGAERRRGVSGQGSPAAAQQRHAQLPEPLVWHLRLPRR